MCTFATNGSCLQHVIPLFDKSCTIEQVSRSVLLVLPVLMESVPLLRGNLRILGNGLYHVPDLCISHTTPLHALLVILFCPILDSASQSISFSVGRGSTELPSQDLVLGSHVASLRSLNPLPELLTFATTTRSSNAVIALLQTIRGAVHPSQSCQLRELCTSAFDPTPKESCLVAS